jgi:Domain of unknown function (DUF5667)
VNSESRRLEMLAERLRAVEPVAPSPAAKIRGWNLVLAAVEQSASRRPRGRSITRLVFAAAAAASLLVVGTVAASADSLPDSPLYAVKGAVEHARGALLFTPADRLSFHLQLAKNRLVEAEAMLAHHRVDLADQALSDLESELDQAAGVVRAEEDSDAGLAAELKGRLQQAIATHDLQLAGLQGRVTNPTALDAIAVARARAAASLLAADKGGGSDNTGAANNGKGNANSGGGNGAAGSPHPTPKH